MDKIIKIRPHKIGYFLLYRYLEWAGYKFTKSDNSFAMSKDADIGDDLIVINVFHETMNPCDVELLGNMLEETDDERFKKIFEYLDN